MKTYVITGATSGIGLSTAEKLARQGNRLVLLGRNTAKGEKLARKLRRRFGNSEVTFLSLDLADFKEVRKVAGKIQNLCPVVDVLINNAGARYDDFLQNDDGYEMSFAGNHLGHFLLTHLLLEPLKSSAAGRIVVVSSVAHRRVKQPVRWIDDKDSFDRWDAYSKSKLANTIFAFHLAAQLGENCVSCNAVDPGLVASNFARNNGLVPWGKHLLWASYKRVLRSPKKAAQEIIEVASSDGFDGVTGKYLAENSIVAPSDLVLDDELARELWTLSRQCVGLEERVPGIIEDDRVMSAIN